jgi:uncharacterized membrane protein
VNARTDRGWLLFAWQATANAVGTVMAVGVIYLVGVISGVVTKANVVAVVTAVGTTVASAVIGVLLVFGMRSVMDEISTRASEENALLRMWESAGRLPPEQRDAIREQLRKAHPRLFEDAPE